MILMINFFMELLLIYIDWNLPRRYIFQLCLKKESSCSLLKLFSCKRVLKMGTDPTDPYSQHWNEKNPNEEKREIPDIYVFNYLHLPYHSQIPVPESPIPFTQLIKGEPQFPFYPFITLKWIRFELSKFVSSCSAICRCLF